MPKPSSPARTIFLTLAIVLLAVASKLTFSLATAPRHAMYVPAGTPEQGMQNWVPTRQHIARGVSCVVALDTTTNPSPLHVTFHSMAGPGVVTIRILRLEGSTSRQGPLNLTPPADPLTIDPIARPTLTWTHPTAIATNLRKAGDNAETLHFTIEFEVTRSGETTRHTMTYDWIPRSFP